MLRHLCTVECQLYNNEQMCIGIPLFIMAYYWVCYYDIPIKDIIVRYYGIGIRRFLAKIGTKNRKISNIRILSKQFLKLCHNISS